MWNDANFNQMLKILIKALHEGSEACGLASRHKSFISLRGCILRLTSYFALWVPKFNTTSGLLPVFFLWEQIPFLAKSPQSNVAGFCGAGGHVRGVFIHSAEALGRSEESCIRNDMPHKKLLIMFSQALTGVFRQTDSFCSHYKMNIIGLLCMQISILLDVYASMCEKVF